MKTGKLSKFNWNKIMCFGIVILAYLVLMPMQQQNMLTRHFSGLLVPLTAYIVMAISLNLTVGILGELSLGHAGFMAVGAYTGVITAISLKTAIANTSLRLLIAIIVGGAFAGFAGLVIGIPVLRLKGDYLAIVTLAFGEIIKNIINIVYVGIDKNGLHANLMQGDAALHLEQGGKAILKGPQGAVGIPKIATFTAGILLILFALVVVLNLVNSKTGRAITAIRDNRIAAESVGIGITRYKLTAFIISAALAGMAGALYAQNFSAVDPVKFNFNTSILVLVFVVLGGLGNIFGSIIATTVLYMLPEMLRGLKDYRMLIYAIVLILAMLLTNSSKTKVYIDRLKETLKYRPSKRNNQIPEEGKEGQQ